MIEFDNRTEYQFDIKLLENIADSLTQKDIELILTDDEEIKKLNKEFRGIDKPTDVLSFPLEDTPGSMLGVIVISLDKVLDAAQKYGHSPLEEFALLFIHGLLHLLGYDHEKDSGEMREKEKEIIEKFHLPKSLIIRNEN
ncbi:rRNA maturation RNase YbeY [Nitrosophilus kaiyonis]|uniref:rRNA maturation RNase YbeY n=1 Tax=Nitrosophilus kaiyonis TaxID=2930200 RepID=UPI002492F508|nr:rRNA maturation RNase YbeY [Nitrosophilus kaiyonis]